MKAGGLRNPGIHVMNKAPWAEALRKSEQKYRNLVENAPIGITISSHDGRILEVNKARLAMSGYDSKEEYLATPLSERYRDVKDRERWIDLVSKRGRVEGFEVELRRKNGTYFWGSMSSIPQTDESGEQQFVIITQDITKRKKAEEALQKSEQNFRNSIENSPLGIRIVTLNGELLYANNAILEIWGYNSTEELKATPTAKLYTSESFAVIEKRLEALKRGQTPPSQYEASIVRKDGDIREMNVFIKEVLWNGEPQFQAIYDDVTERKKAEKALTVSERNFRNSLDSFPFGICIRTRNADLIYANQAILDIYGYGSTEELNEKSPQELYTPQSYLEYEERQKALSLGKPIPVDVELSIVRKDGEIRHLLASRKQVIWDGKPQYQVVYQDITERKRAEEELHRSREQLRTLSAHIESAREAERTEIARAVHDELGQALTALKMDLAWLRKRMSGEPEILIKKTLDMSKLIDSTIQKVKRISTELRPGVLDDLGLTAAIQWQMREFQERTGIKCEIVAQAEDIVEQDQKLATAVFRILQEALTNIARHANATRVKVILKENNETLELQVKDNGKGITQEQIANPKSLGLMGINERTLSWGGEFKISGSSGKGTSLIVRIPLKSEGGM